MKKNDYAILDVTDMNDFGYGVGHLEGKAVFVAGGVTGEKLRIKIIKDGGSYFVARREEMLLRSEKRVSSPCKAFPACGGCSFCHISYEYEKSLKEEFVRSFLRKEGLSHVDVLPLLSTGKCYGYRNKVQYPYRNGVLGYYANRSHRVVENEGCLLHHPGIETLLPDIALFLKEKKIESYNEETGRGLLRHVCLRTNSNATEILLTMVINDEDFPESNELLKILEEKHPEVAGVFLNVNRSKGNVILGEKFIHLWGKKYITDRLLDCDFEISPAAFYQINREGAELLYGEVIRRAEITGGERVADLFCGVGTIGLCLAKNTSVGELIGIEVVPQAVEDAKRNAERNRIGNAKFFCGDANFPALREADVVIVDPPRKGLDEALIKHLSTLDCSKIIYVSCDPSTLARDLARFDILGWQIGAVRPVDMFPRTGHVETVVLLSRKKLTA